MNIAYCIGMTAIAAIWMGAKPVGYLARMGPAPLRFQAPAKGPEHTVALPPLSMKDPDPVVETPSAATTNATTVIEAPAPEPAAEPAPEPVMGPQPFTPQMLLQFFTSTNKEASVIVPYQFSPPPSTTIPPPPSKATYSTK